MPAEKMVADSLTGQGRPKEEAWQICRQMPQINFRSCGDGLMGEELVGETPQLLGIKNSEGVGRDVVVH